jgi:hypothetical protein
MSPQSVAVHRLVSVNVTAAVRTLVVLDHLIRLQLDASIYAKYPW